MSLASSASARRVPDGVAAHAAQAIDDAAASDSGYCFASGDTERWRTYAALRDASLQVARALREAGLRRGDLGRPHPSGRRAVSDRAPRRLARRRHACVARAAGDNRRTAALSRAHTGDPPRLRGSRDRHRQRLAAPLTAAFAAARPAIDPQLTVLIARQTSTPRRSSRISRRRSTMSRSCSSRPGRRRRRKAWR